MPSALVAATDRTRASLLENLAAGLGFSPVVAVRDGEAARAAILRDGLPALLVTELSLPLLDGFALIRWLRARPGGALPTVVASSGFRALRDTALTLRAELGLAAILADGWPAETTRGRLARAIGEAVVEREPPPSAGELEAEADRIAAVEARGLVDGPLDQGLERLVAETARTFGVPVALVNLVLADRVVFKAHVGLAGGLAAEGGAPREWSFCTHVVQAKKPLVVPDAALHPFFMANPLVRAGSLRSYVGAPIVATDGTVLGTLCIIDVRPMTIGAEQVDELVALAARVAGELERRAG